MSYGRFFTNKVVHPFGRLFLEGPKFSPSPAGFACTTDRNLVAPRDHVKGGMKHLHCWYSLPFPQEFTIQFQCLPRSFLGGEHHMRIAAESTSVLVPVGQQQQASSVNINQLSH